MTLNELKQVKESLRECKPDVEDFSWGPTWDMAQDRKKAALRILDREIRNAKKETQV